MTPSRKRLFEFHAQQPVQFFHFDGAAPNGPTPPDEGKAPLSLRVMNALARAAGGAGKTGPRLARAHGVSANDADAMKVLTRTPGKPWDFSQSWKDRQAQEMTRLAATLAADPHVMQAAQDWPQMPRKIREQVLQRVHNIHAAQCGFKPVKLRLKGLESMQLGSMAVPLISPLSRRIKPLGIVLTGLDNARFDAVLELAVHESRHVQQYHLINQMRAGRIAANDPRRDDLLALSRNMDGYLFPSGLNGGSRDADIRAYRAQPAEEDARAAAAVLRRRVANPPKP